MTRFARPLDPDEGVAPRRSPPPGDDDGDGSERGPRVARLVGAAGLVVLTALLFWLLTDDGFRVSAADVDIEGVRLADPAAVRDHISGIDRGPNIFRLKAGDIVEELGALPEVEFARATVALPAEVTVEVVEREPIFIWTNGGDAWLVDEAGVLFSPRAADVPRSSDDAAAGDAFDGLPILEDARVAEPFEPGDQLPAIDIAVMRQLLGITPEFLGSRASSISVRIDDGDGYVLQSVDPVWQAVFGHYLPTVHRPNLVPLQAQCLASLFATERERRIERVVLVPSEERCGTFRRRVGERGPDA